MADQEMDELDSLYDSGDNAGDVSATVMHWIHNPASITYTMDRWLNWPADAGTKHIYITYSAKWSEVFDPAMYSTRIH